MNTALGGKIVAGWALSALSMPTFRLHQTEYPEIEAEGQTPVEACGRLAALLVEAGEAWKRDPLGLALADVRRFSRRFTASTWVEPRLSDRPSM